MRYANAAGFSVSTRRIQLSNCASPGALAASKTLHRRVWEQKIGRVGRAKDQQLTWPHRTQALYESSRFAQAGGHKLTREKSSCARLEDRS